MISSIGSHPLLNAASECAAARQCVARRPRSSNDVPFDDAKDLGSYRTKARTHGRTDARTLALEVTSAFGSSTEPVDSVSVPSERSVWWNTDRLVVAPIVRFRRKITCVWARARYRVLVKTSTATSTL